MQQTQITATSHRPAYSRVSVNGCSITSEIEKFGVTAIAKRAGFTRNYASLVLNGNRKPSFDALVALSNACKCKPGELVEYLELQHAARNANTWKV